jgi:2-polyprenyl-6-hydroxyphenyl methylase/3-demethylubiquinone-9 3-methyltransferase
VRGFGINGLNEEIWRELPAGAGHDPAVHERVLRELAGEPLGRVLDVGCGDGTFAARLAQRGMHVIGLDPAPTALERARAAHPKLDFVGPASDGRLPFDDGSFDAVTCVNVLQHVVDTQSLLSEVRRVLTPGGLLAAAVPFHGRLRNVLIALGAFERHYDPLAPEVRFYTARSLRALLHGFGFGGVALRARGGMPVLRDTLIALARR